MKIALIHDYLAQDGGAERVLKAFHELWPEAPIFVLFHDPKKITGFNKDNIRESFLARFPFIRSHFQWYLPLMPMATERLRLKDFDVVLSSTSAFAKGVITRPGTLHISYCHTPTRYIWVDSEQYVADLPYNFFVKSALPLVVHRLRLWDRLSVDRVDHFVANSRTVQSRISKYYRRDSTVIYPPVDVHRYRVSDHIGNYFVAGGRLVPYKNLDLVIKVFNRLQWPLKIFGTGPEMIKLQKMARENIEFLGKITEEHKSELLSHARAFIHPQIEDFGITPVEAMASGRPVIAYAEGGATETVTPGDSGVFFYKQDWESLLDTLLNFDHTVWDGNRIREHAMQFGVERFKENVEKYVKHRHEEFQRGLKQSPLIQSFSIASTSLS